MITYITAALLLVSRWFVNSFKFDYTIARLHTKLVCKKEECIRVADKLWLRWMLCALVWWTLLAFAVYKVTR